MSPAQATHAAELPGYLMPYKAEYVILQGKKTVGKGTRALLKSADGSFQLSQKSDIRVLFYKDKRQETARFTWQDGQLLPKQYRYIQDTTFKDDRVELTFSPPSEIRGKTSEGSVRLGWEDGLMDPLSYQQQMAYDLQHGKTEMTYRFVKEDRTKEYKFKVMGREKVSTPYGTVDAIRVDRVVNSNKSQTRFWLWPERGHLLVKLSQIKNGKPFLELQLKQVSIAQMAGL